jgi:riboflavin kinase / FMN adenylyltransferase
VVGLCFYLFDLRKAKGFHRNGFRAIGLRLQNEKVMSCPIHSALGLPRIGSFLSFQVLSYFRGSFKFMKVHKDLAKLPLFRNAVITIGTFDGVHTGHQKIINQLKEEATKIGGETVIITFDPHPRKVIGKKPEEIKLINTLEEKIELIASKSIDHLAIVPFTHAFAAITAEEYIGDFLIDKFHPHSIIIGYDHRFGKERKGNYQLLQESCEQYHYALKEIPVHILDSISVSSTNIRKAIETGDFETANSLLGYDYFFEGTVMEGNKLGRTIGYPTANLKIENIEKILPADGVYAVMLEIGETPSLNIKPQTSCLKGMMNIGNRPTVGGTQKTIEVNIFDFDQDIYGRTLRVFVKKRLRSEQKFSGLDDLKAQLAQDKIAATLAMQ